VLKWVFAAFFLVGGLLFSHSVDLITHSSAFAVGSKLEYVISLWFGLFLSGISVSYFCLMFGLLDLVSCVVFVFMMVMMPVFELVMGADILYWILFISFPCTLYIAHRKTKLVTKMVTLAIIIVAVIAVAVISYMLFELRLEFL